MELMYNGIYSIVSLGKENVYIRDKSKMLGAHEDDKSLTVAIIKWSVYMI